MNTAMRVGIAALIGSVIGSLPFLLSKIETDSGTLQSIAGYTTYLLFPGAIVGFVASFGRVHDVNPAVTILSNCVIYSIAVYWFFGAGRRPKAD
jgi:hypothetical protein